MQFSTPIHINQEADITYKSKIMMFGSCFSEHIGNRLDALKFSVSNNPLGILFNPCSIQESIKRIVSFKQFDHTDLFCKEGVWNSFHLHSKFARLSEEDFLLNANQALESAHRFMREASHIFITLGTAWIYELADGGVVANCHKEPQERFSRRRIDMTECVESLNGAIQLIRSLNPTAKITFTVSPIRHWKDGAHENQLSKSTLLLAIGIVQERNRDIQYFPAYEIMMDELRDYRFYASDMLHPNESAIQYIWEKFTACRMTSEAIEQMATIQKLRETVGHRPFNPDCDSHKRFIQKTKENLETIAQAMPWIDFEAEREALSAQL